MNETPAATPRVHAGCGHLCLTCGAKAVLTRWRWRRRDRTCTHPLFCTHCSLCGVPQRRWRRMVPLAGGVMVFLVLQFWLNPPKAPAPHVVQKSWGLASRVTLRADAEGRASFTAPEGLLCSAAFSDGRTVSAGDRTWAGETIHVVGAEPGSVIHVGCW